MEVKVYFGKNEFDKFPSREAFIDTMKRWDSNSDSEDYNNGEGIKTFLEACDYNMEKDHHFTIVSGNDKVTCKNGKLYLNDEFQFNCKG